ncbi:MAG: alpha/beta fold hydrolase [Longimicrobiales bacterium]|nr:alpha/beta fold hydrolase [Longimicrobiales bacterium]
MSWEKLLVAAGAVGAVMVLGALLWPLARHRLIYPGGILSLDRADPAAHGLPRSEQVWLEADDGVRLHAWWTPAEGEARGTVVYCHGNAETLATRAWLADRLSRLGVHVLLFDYRGYGLSQGRASEEGLARDARAAWRHVTRDRETPPDRVVLMGHSLGSAVATRLALELQGDGDGPAGDRGDGYDIGRGRDRSGPSGETAVEIETTAPAALVVGAPFPDMPTLFAHHAPWLPDIALRWRSDRHAAGSRLRRVGVPVLALIADGDEVVPPALSREVIDAASIQADGHTLRLVTVPAQHGTLMGHPDVWAALDRFLDAVL